MVILLRTVIFKKKRGDQQSLWQETVIADRRTQISDRTLMPITEKSGDFWQVFDRNEDEGFFFFFYREDKKAAQNKLENNKDESNSLWK